MSQATIGLAHVVQLRQSKDEFLIHEARPRTLALSATTAALGTARAQVPRPYTPANKAGPYGDVPLPGQPLRCALPRGSRGCQGVAGHRA